MEPKNGSDTSLALVNKFKVVRKGLDKNEVFNFIASLIDQNNEYARKLEHLDSLRKFAEHTVIEASRMAQDIKADIVEKAHEEANAIVADAEKKAKIEAERIIAEADKNSQERISAAEHEATGIVGEARRRAEELAINMRKSAEDQRRSILEDAQYKAQEMKEAAEKEASITQQQAEEQLARIKKIAGDIREQFGRIRQEMLSVLEVDLDEAHAERMSPASGEDEIATGELIQLPSESEQSDVETKQVL